MKNLFFLVAMMIACPLLIIFSSAYSQISPDTICGNSYQNLYGGSGGGGGGRSGCTFYDCDLPFHRDSAQYDSTRHVLTVHLLVHLVRDDNGVGPSLQNVEDMLQKAYDDLRGNTADDYSVSNNMGWLSGAYDTGIDICWSVVLHDSTPLLTADPFFLASNLNRSPQSQINVWVNQFADPSGIQGYAYNNGFSSDHIWVMESQVNGVSKTLVHELGHYFGLIHPQDRLGCSACGENFAQPLAVRDTLGDYCSDTPPVRGATVCFDSSYDCSGGYFGSILHHNFMSYKPPVCSPFFSPQQAGRMRCFLQQENQQLLSFTAIGCPDVPTADFMASLVSTCPGRPVVFTDLSLNAVNWTWDFGDGTGSNLQNPVHAYALPGQYTVTLTVASASGVLDVKVGQTQIIVTSGFPTPYLEPFTMQTGIPFGWGTVNSSPGRNNDRFWRVFRSNTFGVGQRPGPITEGHFAYNICHMGPLRFEPPFWCESPTLGDSSCLTVRWGQAVGDKDWLYSPVLDLSGLNTPIFRFYFSHLPKGSLNNCNQGCAYDFPGLPYTVPVSQNPVCPGTPLECGGANINPSYANGFALNDTLIVEVTPDCGLTWDTLFIEFGENLNTTPSSICQILGYGPYDSTSWRKVEVDLCNYISAPNIQFRFTWIQDFYSGEMYLDEFFVGNGTNPVVSLSGTVDDDCGLQTGQIQGTASGGTPPYTFFLTPVATGVSLNNSTGFFPGLAAGNYVLGVRDSLGNCNRVNLSVGLTPSLVANLTPVDATCGGVNGAVSVSVLFPGQYTYRVKQFGQVVLGPQTVSGNGFSVSPLASGNYVVEIEDTMGNCTSQPFSLGNTTTLTPSVTIQNETCQQANGSITVNAPSGGSFMYTLLNLGTGQIQTNGNGAFSGLIPGTYEVCADDSMANCGCDTVTVGTQPPLNLILSVTDDQCNQGQGSISVQVQGGPQGNYSYTLTDFFNVPLAGSGPVPQSNYSFSMLSSGWYGIEVLGPNGNCGGQLVQVQNDSSLLAFFNITQPTCAQPLGSIGAFILNNSMPLEYEARDANTGNLIVSGIGPFGFVNIGPLSPGEYEILLRDTNGVCTNRRSTLLPPGGIPYTYQLTPSGCPGFDLVLYFSGATPPLTVELFDSSGTQLDSLTSSNPDSLLYSGLLPGAYNWIGTDSMGNCFYLSLSIPSNQLPVSITSQDPGCATGGSITVDQPSGPGIQYVLTDTGTGQIQVNQSGSFNGLVAGTYAVCAIDSFGNCGCDTLDLNPAFPLLIADTLQFSTCDNPGNGSISLGILNGSTGSYSYDLVQAATGNTYSSPVGTGSYFGFSGLPSGTYFLNVTGPGNSCALDTFFLPFLDLLNPTFLQLDDASCITGLGLVSIDWGGTGTPPFSFVFRDSATGAVVNSGSTLIQAVAGIQLSSGAYTFSVSSSEGYCTSIPFTIGAAPPTIPYSLDLTHPFCTRTNGEIIVRLNGATPPLNGNAYTGGVMTWTVGQSNDPDSLSFPGLSPGNTHIFLEDANGRCVVDSFIQLNDSGCCLAPAPNIYVVGRDSISEFMAVNGSDTFVTKTFYVVDTLFIDSTVYLDKVTFKMETGAVVYVHNWDTMVHLAACAYDTACGDSMWDGIYVNPGAGWTGQANVSNSENGLVGTGTAYLKVQGLTFFNNYRSIQVRSHQGLGAWPGEIGGTDFFCVAVDMIPPYAGVRAHSGVWVRQVDSIQIGMVGPSLENVFSGMDVGLRIEEANAGIYNNEFRNIVARTDGGGEFVPGTGTAILARGTGSWLLAPRYRVTIGDSLLWSDNYFAECTFGVDAVFHYAIFARNNLFEDSDPTQVSCIDAIRNRWSLNYTSIIENNVIRDWHHGIRLLAMAGSDVTVRNNQILSPNLNTATGIEINDISWNGLHPTSWVGTRYAVEDNEIQVNGTGILVMGARGARMRRNELTIEPPTGANTAFGIRIDGSFRTLVRNNTFASTGDTLRDMVGLYGRMSPENVISCNVWEDFGFPLVFESVLCDGTELWENDMRNGVVGLLLRRNGVIGFQVAGIPPKNRWLGSFSWAATFTDNSNGLQSRYFSGSSSIQSSTHPFPNGARQGVPVPVSVTRNSRVIQCPPIQIGPGPNGGRTLQNIAAGRMNFDNLTEQFQAEGYLLGKLLTDSTLVTNDPLFQNCLPALCRQEQFGLFEVEDSLALHFLQSAKTINDGLMVTEVPAINQKELNKAILKWLDPTGPGLTASDLVAVEHIAEQCPREGGFAVFPARSLLTALGYDNFEQDTCLGFDSYQGTISKQEPQKLEGKNLELIFVPNPARNEVRFWGVGPAKVRILDLQGQEMTSFIFGNEGNSYLLSVSSWARGIYLVEQLDGDGGLKRKKLVLQ